MEYVPVVYISLVPSGLTWKAGELRRRVKAMCVSKLSHQDASPVGAVVAFRSL